MEVRLRRGRARPLWAGHSWVLSGAIESVTGEPEAGTIVLVRDHAGREIGRGFYAPASPIRVRMLTRDPAETIDFEYFAKRIRRAVEIRRLLGLPADDTTAYRLVHSDGDGLPGVVVDVFGEHAVVQLTVRGMEDRRDVLAAALAEIAGVKGALLRRVTAFEEGEGLAGAEGNLLPVPVPEEIAAVERGLSFLVRPAVGQKTGHYLDHRENRALFRRFAAGRSVLDLFCGAGGFSLAAAAGGAREVLGIDSSGPSLAAAADNARRNGFGDHVRFDKGDVFRVLRDLEAAERRYDAIVIDPPRMASRRKDLEKALRGYKELNLRAMRLLAPGGILATASCTGLVAEEDFERKIRDAALDAKRELTVLHRQGQAPDHPWSIAAPEGRYLKFLLGRADPL